MKSTDFINKLFIDSSNLESVLPADISYCLVKDDPTISIKMLIDQLSPNEQEIANSINSNDRRREFCLGRISAKQAFLKLHQSVNSFDSPLKDFQVLRINNKAPLWPDSYIGSISHCKKQAISILCKKKTCRGLGIDILSMDRKVDDKVLRRICGEEEFQKLKNNLQLERVTTAQIIFSAKESLYKLFSSLGYTQLSLKDFSLELRRKPNLQDIYSIQVTISNNLISSNNSELAQVFFVLENDYLISFAFSQFF